MRKFVAGCCCLIVGLEVLVGVPLAVCLAFFAVTQGAGPIAVQVSPSSFDATVPPPSFGAQCTAAYPAPFPATVPWSPVPVAPTVATSPCTDPVPVERNERVDDAIAEYRQRNGDPLRGTFVGSERPLPAVAAESPASSPAERTRQLISQSEAYQTVADEWERIWFPDLPGQSSQPPAREEGTPADSKPQSCSLNDALQCSIQQLYALANSYEDQGNFGRADQVRKLAREIREEAEIIKLHDSHRCISAEAATGAPPAGSADAAPKPAN